MGAMFDLPTIQALPRSASNSPTQGVPIFAHPLKFMGETVNYLGMKPTKGLITAIANLGYESAFTDTFVLAPFYTDMDNRDPSTEVIGWGGGVVGGKWTYWFNWLGVAPFATEESARTAPLNYFQAAIIYQDSAGYDWDVVFNYDDIAWDIPIYGESAAWVGLSALPILRGSYEGGFTDQEKTFISPIGYTYQSTIPMNTTTNTGSVPLARTSTNSDVPGRHVFQVRGGEPQYGSSALSDSESSERRWFLPRWDAGAGT